MNEFFNSYVPLLPGIAFMVASGVLVLSILIFIMTRK